VPKSLRYIVRLETACLQDEENARNTVTQNALARYYSVRRWVWRIGRSPDGYAVTSDEATNVLAARRCDVVALQRRADDAATPPRHHTLPMLTYNCFEPSLLHALARPGERVRFDLIGFRFQICVSAVLVEDYRVSAGLGGVVQHARSTLTELHRQISRLQQPPTPAMQRRQSSSNESATVNRSAAWFIV